MASKAKTASAKSATAEPARKDEEIVEPVVAEPGDEASAVVAADSENDQAEATESKEEVPAKAKSEDTWKKDKNAEIPKRVFRSLKWKNGVVVKVSLITLNRQAGMYKGTNIDALTITSDPNHAAQHVLKSGAIDYADQLAAFRKYEKLGKVEEVDPRFEGALFVPESEKRIRKLEAELKAAKAQRS